MTLDASGLAPLPPDALVLQAPCAACGCGSYCHWDDVTTPPLGMKPWEWALIAKGVECQRCPCKGYRIVKPQEPRLSDKR